jgi:hypothetical protein
MGGRDHSFECEECGLYRGGLNYLLCDCDAPQVGPMEAAFIMHHHISILVHNLAIGAALCRAFRSGSMHAWRWEPGCGREAP